MPDSASCLIVLNGLSALREGVSAPFMVPGPVCPSWVNLGAPPLPSPQVFFQINHFSPTIGRLNSIAISYAAVTVVRKAPPTYFVLHMHMHGTHLLPTCILDHSTANLSVINLTTEQIIGLFPDRSLATVH
jgi:hypothetical protein